MPATCTFLLHQPSLLLLLGLHLFVGSSPLDSPSSSSPSSASSSSSTYSPQFTTGLQGSAAPTPEASSFAAPSLERKSPEPSTASSGAWDPATEGRSSNPAIMSSQKAIESSHTESRTSSSTTDNGDAFSTFDNDKGRTLRLITDSGSVSTAAIGKTTSYPETGQFGDLTQDSSLVLQTRRADALSSTLDISEVETVPLMTHSPHTAVSSLSEHNFPATGSSHHRDTSWDVENITSRLHTESMNGSASTVNKERTSQFLTDSVTLTNSATKGPVSQTEFTVSSDQTQFPSQATQTRSSSTTSNTVQFPVSVARTVLTHSLLSSNTAAEGDDHLRSNSSTEQSIFTSQMESLSVLGVSDRSGGRTVPPLIDTSHSHNATQTSVSSGNEISSSLSHTHSSYVLTPEQTSGMNLSLGDTDFTEIAHVHSQAYSETTDDRNNQHTSNIEKRATQSQTDSIFSSATLFSDGAGTLEAQTNKSKSIETTEISSFGSNDFSSSDLTQTSSPALENRRNHLLSTYKDFTETSEEPLLTYSSKASFYLPSTIDLSNVRTKQHTFSTSNTGKGYTQTKSTFSSVASIRDGNGTLESLTNSSKFTEATPLSTFDLEDIHSSDLTQSSSVTMESRKNPISSKEMHFTRTSEEPFLTYSSNNSIYSPSTIDLSSPGKSHQPVNISDPQGRISSASTDSVYLSTTFIHGAERTLRSLPDNNTSDAAESSISHTEASSSSNPALILTSVAEAKEHNVSLSEGQFTEHFTEHLLEHSSLVPISSSSPEDPSTIGSGHHRASSSGTEARASYSYTDTMHSSASFSNGEEQTSQSVMNTTFTDVTESSSSYVERSSASELNHSLSGIYSEMTDFSGKDLDISGPSTETVQSFTSSRIPTYSSFQSEPSDTGSDFGRTNTEKTSSSSHTDSTYISGGERTLLSISNNSTSFYAEMSTPDSAQSSFSMTQNIGSNLSSSDRDFSAPSTEPLALQSLHTPGYSSTVSYSISESTSAINLSFLSSSPASSLQSSLPPTQPPTLFSSSESSQPALSSAFPTQLSSQMPSLTPSPRLSSTALPTFPPFSYTSPAPSSKTSLQPSINLATSVSITERGSTTGIDSSTARSFTSKYTNQTRTYLLKDSTDPSSTRSSPFLTEATEQVTNYSTPVTISLGKTKSSRELNVSLPGTSVEKSLPVLTTSPTYLSESSTVSGTAKSSSDVLPRTTQKDVFSSVEVTTGKKLTNMTRATVGLPTMATPTNYAVTAKSPKVQSPSSTKMPHTSETTTKGMEMSSAPTVKVLAPHASTTQPPTFSSRKPTTRSFSTLPIPIKPTTVAWLGSQNTFTTFHGKDIDECLSNPCPALATCTNTQGSFQCTCSLGYQMEKGKCNLVRTFVGQFPLTFNTTGGKYSELRQIEGDLINALNTSLSALPGYYTSTVKASRQSASIQVSITSTFSVVSNVTLYDIVSAVRSHIRACKASSETCRFMSSLTQLHRAGGLCKYKDPECDKETSACVDFSGIADCQCKPGYFRYNKLDHSCRACEDGYKLENDTCVSCPFGLGGFNCGNPYQLITIVIAAAGGVLLLILGIALIVTCCQKNKNDISKLIFKSGDFQMSPYAEYPKNPRVQDWGRETIEMQENGSTKNLLQMTDVYYMPTNLRNPELERNGLYPPYTGLPGSRHSCIYPGQYNPSFISDDSRRRDYF
ncbi:protein HEG homolog 1 [Eublepharis macularius]|uniref:Protein HEG homolog 1 n=1 Tax=Eublepharis macularius TaxID=481883 RepID=A0AA97KSN6_EUBMA|nr:protein HEG homolog 1 [Eublepharis macularius]